MKLEDYLTLKNDAIFNATNSNVCEICFMSITSYCDFAKSNLDNVLRSLRPHNYKQDSKLLQIPVKNQTQINFNKSSIESSMDKRINDRKQNNKLYVPPLTKVNEMTKSTFKKVVLGQDKHTIRTAVESERQKLDSITKK
jgi:hypothetical protein